jgi:uncharacterized protein YyaL (SSP411 family)
LGEKSYLEVALRNARFLEETMMFKAADGGLWRNYMHSKADIPGMLDDYAFLASAFIELYQVTFDMHWLTLAHELAGYMKAHFHDPETDLFFYTSDRSEKLVARKKEIEDNVLPSSNSVAANVLFRLGIYFDNPAYIHDAKEMLSHVTDAIPSGVPYFANWVQLLGLIQKGPYEIAVMGKDALEKSNIMQRNYLPDTLFMGGDTEDLPLLKDKLIKGKTMIYVCENKACKLPVTEPEKALEQIK